MRRLAYWAGPMLVCLCLHWAALRSWFSNDDFAWLGLPLEVHSAGDLGRVLFSPMAEGTVRVFSERLYFLVLGSLFHLNAVPFRIVAFATQMLNVGLLVWITRRLTGSALAGLLAPLLWCVNFALADPLGWASDYNEILFAFCVLLALLFCIRWLDTGERRYWYWQWAPYLFGFGVLEAIVVYPALALVYTAVRDRKAALRQLWLFLPALAFTALHFSVIQPPSEGVYKPVWSFQVVRTLGNYWMAAVVGAFPDQGLGAFSAVEACVVIIALAWFAVRQWRDGNRTGVWLLAWFPLALAPVLPLPKHFSFYYLTVPVLGLSILGAWALSAQRRMVWAGVLVAAGYIVCTGSLLRASEKDRFEKSRRLKHLITALERHKAEWNGKAVMLDGVDNQLFWAGFYDSPFRLIGIEQVTLVPGGERTISRPASWGDVSRYIISVPAAYQELSSGKAVVYAASGHLTNVTAQYLDVLKREMQADGDDIVSLRDPNAAERLGEGWYSVEGDFRWSAAKASVMMYSKQPGQKLSINGFCPDTLLKAAPLGVMVFTNGEKAGSVVLSHEGSFQLDFALPADVAGHGAVDVAIETSRAYQSTTDSRSLGLLIASFTIQK